jgi:Ni,Fe-hydrogenase III small subunit
MKTIKEWLDQLEQPQRFEAINNVINDRGAKKLLCTTESLSDALKIGFYWQDSRSPRSSVAVNSEAPEDLLRTIFQEEAADSAGLSDFPHPVLWRLTCNPSAPEDVLEGIITLIEKELVTDEYAQNELLVGEPDDFPYGLVTNPAVKGKLRERVEALMKARDMNPADFEINES